MVKRAELEPMIVQEWLKRPRDKLTETDVLAFHGFLTHRADLLGCRVIGDKYEVLHSIPQKAHSSVGGSSASSLGAGERGRWTSLSGCL